MARICCDVFNNSELKKIKIKCLLYSNAVYKVVISASQLIYQEENPENFAVRPSVWTTGMQEVQGWNPVSD